MTVFSSVDQLDEIGRILSNLVKLPFVEANIPGSMMESVLSHVRDGAVLNTYDFVDVISLTTRRGWQVKSTKADTPVTWKRAKIPNAVELIEASKESESALQALGDAVIEFCNDHARASLNQYGLDEIGYSRLVLHKTGRATYFERLLCSKNSPNIFDPTDYRWQWSKPKATVKKEQLPALHGIRISTGKKWWAWHGRGENQLHFSGESEWWPDKNNSHQVSFALPSNKERLSVSQLVDLFAALDP